MVNISAAKVNSPKFKWHLISIVKVIVAGGEWTFAWVIFCFEVRVTVSNSEGEKKHKRVIAVPHWPCSKINKMRSTLYRAYCCRLCAGVWSTAANYSLADQLVKISLSDILGTRGIGKRLGGSQSIIV